MEDKTIEILEKYLDKDFRVSPMAPNKSTLSDLKEIENKLGVKFPDEYIVHLLADGANVLGERGLYIEVKEDVWPRPKEFDVGPFWSFLYGLYTFTASKESEGWMRLETAGQEFIDETGILAVPILQVIGDSDLYCANEDGKIVQYNHEENTIEDLNMNFWELFDRELKELRARKDMKINERSI